MLNLSLRYISKEFCFCSFHTIHDIQNRPCLTRRENPSYMSYQPSDISSAYVLPCTVVWAHKWNVSFTVFRPRWISRKSKRKFVGSVIEKANRWSGYVSGQIWYGGPIRPKSVRLKQILIHVDTSITGTERCWWRSCHEQSQFNLDRGRCVGFDTMLKGYDRLKTPLRYLKFFLSWWPCSETSL